MKLPREIQAVLKGRQRWCVVQASCLELLPAFADGAVVHVIADPPYDKKTHAGSRSLGADASAINFDPLASLGFVPELLRIAQRWVLAFCALRQLDHYAAAAGEERYIRDGIWNRPDGTPQLTGDRPGQGAEGIAIMHRTGRKRWNAGGKRAVWTHGVARADRVHPTQKPVPLMVELLEDFTDPGELVLDPFCGSGTTGIACLRLGRRFIGIERDRKYARIARERLAAESQGLTLSAARAANSPCWEVPDERTNFAPKFSARWNRSRSIPNYVHTSGEAVDTTAARTPPGPNRFRVALATHAASSESLPGGVLGGAAGS